MPHVTVQINESSTIVIYSRDDQDKPANSVDLSGADWAETNGWDVKRIQKVLELLEGQGNEKHVNCMQGQNRSPTMAILYIWKKKGCTLGNAFNAVKNAYPADGTHIFGESKSKLILAQLLLAYAGGTRRAPGDIFALTHDAQFGF